MPDAAPLRDRFRALIGAPDRFAMLATPDPSGAPLQAFVRYRLDPYRMLVVNRITSPHDHLDG